MGHADIQTTMRYVHHVPKTGAARQFTEAIERLKAAGELGAASDEHPVVVDPQTRSKSHRLRRPGSGLI